MKSLSQINRRHFLKGTAAAAAASIAAPAIVRAADRELRILTWEGYAGPEWLDKFKSDTGATVNIVYAGSADEMFAKMQGSQAADFDIVSFDTSLFPRYIDAKLIQPMDPSKIPNIKNIASEFAGVEAVMRGDDRYGLPFAWGSLPLVYDTAGSDVGRAVRPADAVDGRREQLHHARGAHRRRHQSISADG
ncbi:MAG: extracellular solute-binding protein [Alphaproteobacteria bacterium]|nr:extracellular solute-binding protein [Alphaproteobacteria bacterium]